MNPKKPMRSKKTFWRSKWLWLLLLLLLAGGGGGYYAWTKTSAAVQSGQSAQQGAPNLANQPIENKLAVGLLKLEGTGQGVTAAQAQTLLPLWKAVKILSSSSTASADEISALYQQIQESLTAEQLQAVKDLNLAPADTQALMTQYGVEMPRGAPQVSSTRTAGGSNTGTQGGFPGGGGIGGAPLDGSAFPGSGQPNLQTTPQAGATPRAGRAGGGMNLLFVDPLIKLLETRAGS